MHWRITYVVMTACVFMFGGASLVQAADDPLVDRQDTAIATNLGLFGGSPQDIVVDASADGQYVYVATYTPNGIFSSSDFGVTWSGISGDVDYGAGKALVVDPDTGDVYGEIGDNVIKSTDHGVTWTSLTDRLEGNPVMGAEMLWTDGTLIVAVNGGMVQVSSDSGDTFTAVVVSGDSSESILSLSGDSAGGVYAVTQDNATNANGVYYSADHGESWAVVDVEAGGVEEGSLFYAVVVDPLNAAHVILTSYHPDYNSYQSFDSGATWSALTNGELHIGGQEAEFDGVGGLYLGMFHTTDASVESPEWSALTSDTPLSSVRGDIYAVDTAHPGTVFSNSSMGVAKSSDGGASWVDSVEGIMAVKTYAITQAEDKDMVWIGADGGLAKTINFTAEQPDWEYPITPTESGSTIYAVWVKPTDGNYVVTAAANFLYYTEDGGETWVQADAPDFFGTVQDIVVSPNDADTLYALYANTSLIEDEYNGGILKSVDAGQTWEEMNFPSTLADGAIAVAYQNGNDVVYVGIGSGGTETGVYVFAQGEWSKLSEDFGGFYSNSLLVHPDDAQTLFATFEASSTEGSLYKTTNGGETWVAVSAGLENANHLGAMTVQVGETSTLYLAGQDNGTNYGMLYKSTDGGESWSAYYQGKRQEFFYDLLFDGLVSGNDRGVFNLQSLGKVRVQKESLGNHQFSLHVTLTDAATQDILAHKKVLVYKKPKGKPWRVVRARKTNEDGERTFTVTARKGTKLKVVWKPKTSDTAEYARSVSRVVRIP